MAKSPPDDSMRLQSAVYYASRSAKKAACCRIDTFVVRAAIWRTVGGLNCQRGGATGRCHRGVRRSVHPSESGSFPYSRSDSRGAQPNETRGRLAPPGEFTEFAWLQKDDRLCGPVAWYAAQCLPFAPSHVQELQPCDHEEESANPQGHPRPRTPLLPTALPAPQAAIDEHRAPLHLRTEHGHASQAPTAPTILSLMPCRGPLRTTSGGRRRGSASR